MASDFDEEFILDFMMSDDEAYNVFFGNWNGYKSIYVPFKFSENRHSDTAFNYKGTDYIRVGFSRDLTDSILYRTRLFLHCEENEAKKFDDILAGKARIVKMRKCFTGTANPRKKVLTFSE